MKDPTHHNWKASKKVIQSVRQEAEKAERRPKRVSEPGGSAEEQMSVETVENPLVIRPLNLRFKESARNQRNSINDKNVR